MKKSLLVLHILFLVFILSLPKDSFSQGIGIGTITPDASAALDITTTSKGLLIPRMSLASINAITNPAKGLLVYDSLTNKLMANIGTAATPNWQPVAGNNSSGWNLTGNSGINPANQFIGTTDNLPLRFRVNNIPAGELHPVTGNIFWGLRAGQANTTGFSNIAIGTGALKLNTIASTLVAIGDSALFNNNGGSLNTAIGSKSLFSNTSGSNNTATGNNSLFSNTGGSFNTANGWQSLFANTTGSNNTAFGSFGLSSNTTGEANTATGFGSLFSNTTGVGNTATGFRSLIFNTTGINNTGVGTESLFSNTTGGDNTAIGFGSLLFNNSGTNNTAIGSKSLFLNTSGLGNTATGFQSLFSNSTGNGNTATGFESLLNNTTGFGNTAIGDEALVQNTGGNSNTAIGVGALASASGSSNNTAVGAGTGFAVNLGFNNTLIGANSTANQNGLFNCVALGESSTCTASSQVRLGNTSTSSIGGVVGYTNLSDGRYKKNIQEAVKGIDFIMKLRPVTYQLDIEGLNKKLNVNAAGKMNDTSKKDINENEKTIFSGFVAQEVEQAAKNAGYNFSGVDKPKNENDMYGLRYAEFVVPLVKAMQEQQQIINELKNQNADLQKRVLTLEKK